MNNYQEWADSKLIEWIAKNSDAIRKTTKDVSEFVRLGEWELAAEFSENLRSQASGLKEMALEAERRRHNGNDAF